MKRLLIVDDSAFMRKMIRQMIEEDGSFEIVGLARDGAHAVELAKQHTPDLITLDIEMPNKDGLEALREIRMVCRNPAPKVLMCSSLTVAGSTVALKALKLGAADVIAKDPDKVGKNDEGFRKELLSKLHALSGGHGSHPNAGSASHPAPVQSSAPTDQNDIPTPDNLRAVVIGASTGGPPVLEVITGKLPSNPSVPIVIAQHMPQVFTKSLADRLNDHAACEVLLATKGVSIEPGKVYIAEGGHHLSFTRIPSGRIIGRYHEEHPGAIYKPSVDLLFESAAEIYGGANILAIQLTGMGEDGAIGAAKIHKAGGTVIAQDEETCVVFGMPGAVAARGLAHGLLKPDSISAYLNRCLGTPASSNAAA